MRQKNNTITRLKCTHTHTHTVRQSRLDEEEIQYVYVSNEYFFKASLVPM